MKQCCFDYISTEALPTSITPRFNSAQSEASRHRFPFLEYALHNVLYHADTAEGAGISQVAFLKDFPHPRWIELRDFFAIGSSHTTRVSLLYMLADLNNADVIRIHPSIWSCVDVENERFVCALFAASALGNKEAMHVCIEALRNHPSMAKHSEEWHDGKEERARLILGHEFQYRKDHGVSLHAVTIGSAIILRYLFGSRTFDRDFCRTNNHSALRIAAGNGNAVIVRILLEEDANVDDQGGTYDSPLCFASQEGHV